MIKWLKNLFKSDENEINPDDYPKKLEEKEVEATGCCTKYTIKVVWADGSKDLMKCDEYNLKHDNALEIGFLDRVRTYTSGSEAGLNPKYNIKRTVDPANRRYWEIVNREEVEVKKDVTLAKYEVYSSFDDLVKTMWEIEEEEEGYEVVNDE